MIDNIDKRRGFKRKTFQQEDFYLAYPYKKQREKKGNTIQARPYVKQVDVTDHEFSLDYDQWKTIIKCYLEVILESLFEGHSYMFSSMIGELRLVKMPYTQNRDLVDYGATIKKYISKYNVDWMTAKRMLKEDETPDIVLHDNRHSREYIVKLRWRRKRGYVFSWKNDWFFQMSKEIGIKINKFLKSNIYAINKIAESNSVNFISEKVNRKERDYLIKVKEWNTQK